MSVTEVRSACLVCPTRLVTWKPGMSTRLALLLFCFESIIYYYIVVNISIVLDYYNYITASSYYKVYIINFSLNPCATMSAEKNKLIFFFIFQEIMIFFLILSPHILYYLFLYCNYVIVAPNKRFIYILYLYIYKFLHTI